MDLFSLIFNPIARLFRRDRHVEDAQLEMSMRNSQGVSQEEIDTRNFMSYDALANPSSTYVGIQFEQYFGNKAGRIQKYREMSRYPIIKDGINQICDEAIIDNHDGDIVNLELKTEMPRHIQDQIYEIWDHMVNNIFRFNERGWDFFRKWLEEGELYIELVINDAGDDIIDIKVLPAHTMMPVYEENRIKGYIQINAQQDGIGSEQGNVDYAMQQPVEGSVVFDRDQVVYVNFGDTGDNILDVRGYLDSSIRTYNQLKNMEDALVIHRLVRAPQRRIWNIYTGKMPKTRAEEYVRGLTQRYRKKIIYDSSTGAMDSSQNVQSLTEDFWFTKDINGNGTSVDTIGGDANFGEMDDINYFQQNLYKTLMLPKSRYGEDAAQAIYSSGKAGEIQREEIKFSRYVDRMRRRFKYMLLDPFLTLLRLKGIDDIYIDYNNFNVRFIKQNLYKEYMELELLESKVSLLASVSEFMYNPDENPSGLFAPEFIISKFFMMSDEDWNENKDMIDRLMKNKEKGMGDDVDSGEEGFGGEEGGEEGFGGAEEPQPGEGQGEPEGGGEDITAPESLQYTINNANTLILKEWNDSSILSKKSNKIINKIRS